jgi:transcriptional regulator with XRE-family HTH domain
MGVAPYHLWYIFDVINSMIRHCRLRAGLTQSDLARRAGISQPALARIESGRVIPRVDTAARLLHECGMRLEPVELAGQGIDRSTIRRMLALTPRQRLALAAKEANNLSALQRRRR